MDAMTPRGQEALAQARLALRALEARTGVEFVEFSDSKPADVDGFVLRRGKPVALYEVKARNMSLDDLVGRFRNEWLVSYEKLHRARTLAMSLHLPLFGILHCTKDGVVLTCRIWDEHGNCEAPMRLEVTETQATCNGGVARRTNAFINMQPAMRYQIS